MSDPTPTVRSLPPEDDAVSTLRRIPLLSELGVQDLERLLDGARRIVAAPGEVVIEEGAAADGLYVVLDGEVEVFSSDGTEEVLLAVEGPGSFLGEMALLEDSPRSASVRAVVTSEFLVLGPERFRELLAASPPASMTMLHTVLSRLRNTEETLMERERLAALGTLTAGLAHELNNPAAALPRTAQHLSELITEWGRRSAEVEGLGLEESATHRLRELSVGMAESAESQSDPLLVSETEAEVEEWLENEGFEEPWELSVPLAAAGWTVQALDDLSGAVGTSALRPVIEWLATGLTIHGLAAEMRRSAKAVSEVVAAVRMYSHQQRAAGGGPVDVAESIASALTLVRHRMKEGIELIVDVSEDLPKVTGNPSDLGQVWTILMENAVDAMNGVGRLEIRASSDGKVVTVEVTDAGPGISREARKRLFEPFFTTKPPGKGTGLGLSIAHRIVVNDHSGQIRCQSEPGRTVFTVLLPAAADGND